jgi:hypothetical protein
MLERNADCHDRGLDLLLDCTEDPSVNGSRRLNRIGIGIKVDRRQQGVDKGAESSPAWPLEVPTLHDFDLDIRTKQRARIFGLPFEPAFAVGSLCRLRAGQRRHGPNRQRGLGCPGEQRLARLSPGSVALFACSSGGTHGIHLQNALVPEGRLLFDIKQELCRIPPHDGPARCPPAGAGQA